MAPLRAKELGATGFGMFTKNQRQWVAKDLSEQSILDFKKNMIDCGYLPEMVLPHDSYLINLSNSDPEKHEKSLNAFIDELKRVEQLGLIYLNFHPGSHLKAMSPQESAKLIGQSINRAMEATETAICVIENTAGQGTNMGSSFEEIAQMIENVENKDRIGVCLDTCHLFAAGYDLVGEEAFEKTFDNFDTLIGFSFLKGMHINDAKSTLSSNLDRHHSLGLGNIGWDPFERIMKDDRFSKIPLILETIDETLWKEEISQLKEWDNS